MKTTETKMLFCKSASRWAGLKMLVLGIVLPSTLAHQAAHQLGDTIAGVMAFFFLPAFAPGFATGLIVSLSPRAWPLSRIAVLFFPLFFLAVALQVPGMPSW